MRHFSATTLLEQTKKDGTRCCGAKVKKMASGQRCENKVTLIHAISNPNLARKSNLNAIYCWYTKFVFAWNNSAELDTARHMRQETSDRIRETGDLRPEAWDLTWDLGQDMLHRNRETGDVRQEPWGRRLETEDGRQETRDVRQEKWDKRREPGDKVHLVNKLWVRFFYKYSSEAQFFWWCELFSPMALK